MAGLGQSMTGQKTLDAIGRQRQALELRKTGMNFQHIADQLGYRDASGAWKAVTKALKESIKEPADSVRLMELARLDAMLVGIWTQAKSGNTNAIDRALKIMDRRAAYLGLDAPAKIDLKVMIEAAVRDLELTDDERSALISDVQDFMASDKVTNP